LLHNHTLLTLSLLLTVSNACARVRCGSTLNYIEVQLLIRHTNHLITLIQSVPSRPNGTYITGMTNTNAIICC